MLTAGGGSNPGQACLGVKVPETQERLAGLRKGNEDEQEAESTRRVGDAARE